MKNKILENIKNNFSIIKITGIYNQIPLKNKLQKTPTQRKIIILNAPKIIDQNHHGETPKISNPKIRNYIEKFITKMESSLPKDCLITMYNNLYTLTVNENDFYLILSSNIRDKFRKKIRGGFYSLNKNKITIYSESGLEYIKEQFNLKKELTLDTSYNHELLHMSSTIKKNKNYFTGFNHNYPSVSIGLGINEGYTELLNERIFNSVESNGLYCFYKEVTRILEMIIGQDKMIKLYFTSDLKGLFLELNKYIYLKNTKKFIVELDNLKIDKNNIPDIIEYLIILFINKITKELENHQITKEKAKENIEEFKKNIIKLNKIIKIITNNNQDIQNIILKKTKKINQENENLIKIRSRKI